MFEGNKTAADGWPDQYSQKDCSVILNRSNCFAHIMDDGRNYVKTILLTRALPALWLQLSSLCLQLCCGELCQRTLRHSAPAAAAKVCLLGSGALNKNPCCQNFRILSYFEYSRYLWHFPTLAPSGGKSAGGLMRWSGQVRCSIRPTKLLNNCSICSPPLMLNLAEWIIY